jgi:hypothetical protein
MAFFQDLMLPDKLITGHTLLNIIGARGRVVG